jgi:prepilin-type N-terminal cleavage/methylation domain-containing protein
MKKNTRGFTLMEMLVVVAVIAIGGSMAMLAISEQMLAARTRSDIIGMELKVREQRDRGRERMEPVILQGVDGGIVVSRAIVRFPTVPSVGSIPDLSSLTPVLAPSSMPAECMRGEQVARFEFAHAVAEGSLCLSETGRPLGVDRTLHIGPRVLPATGLVSEVRLEVLESGLIDSTRLIPDLPSPDSPGNGSGSGANGAASEQIPSFFRPPPIE